MSWHVFSSHHLPAKHKSKRYTRKPKVVPLSTAAISFITSIKPAEATGLVFRTQKLTPWNKNSLGTKVRRLRDRAGISEDAKLHGLRHSFGTRMVLAGVPIKAVSVSMGHSSVSITERFYVNLSASDIGSLRAQLDRG